MRGEMCRGYRAARVSSIDNKGRRFRLRLEKLATFRQLLTANR
jgi:hypothetical protein